MPPDLKPDVRKILGQVHTSKDYLMSKQYSNTGNQSKRLSKFPKDLDSILLESNDSNREESIKTRLTPLQSRKNSIIESLINISKCNKQNTLEKLGTQNHGKYTQTSNQNNSFKNRIKSVFCIKCDNSKKINFRRKEKIVMKKEDPEWQIPNIRSIRRQHI